MQLIIINECAFKMILSSAEMKEYGIDEDEFHISGCKMRQALKKIIKSRPEGAALQNIHENEKLIIQLWQKEDGGCELFVTRLPLESDFLEENGMTDKNDSNLPIPGTKKEAPRRPTTMRTWQKTHIGSAAGVHWDSIRRITLPYLSRLLETDTTHLCRKDSSLSGISSTL